MRTQKKSAVTLTLKPIPSSRQALRQEAQSITSQTKRNDRQIEAYMVKIQQLKDSNYDLRERSFHVKYALKALDSVEGE
jgi:hypothetical protein